MRKLISVLLSVIMLISLTIPVMAASGSVTLVDSETNKSYITVSGIDTAAEPDKFTISYTYYDYETEMEKEAERYIPIYPANGAVTVTLTDSLNWFSVTKTIDKENKNWDFNGQDMPIKGTAKYITYDTSDTSQNTQTDDNPGGYDDSSGNIPTPIEHIIDASEVTEEMQIVDGCCYQSGCTVSLTEPGLYYIYGSIGPVLGYSEGFIRIGTASTAAVQTQHEAGGFYPSDWARSEVNAARATGLLPNYWYESYDCLANITRQGFCELAAKLYCLNSNMPMGMWAAGPFEPTFSDAVSQEIEMMYWLKVVDGVGSGKFAPDNELTREQAAKILTLLYNTAEPGSYDENHDYRSGKTITDSASVSTWADNYIGFVMEKGIMTGVGNDKFDPQGKYTVQQALLTMYRLAGRTDLWTAEADGAPTIYDLGINRNVFGGSVIYVTIPDSNITDITCTGVKIDDKTAEFSGGFGLYSRGELFISCETTLDQLTRYELSLTVTMADGTVHEFVDCFQCIDDMTGGA